MRASVELWVWYIMQTQSKHPSITAAPLIQGSACRRTLPRVCFWVGVLIAAVSVSSPGCAPVATASLHFKAALLFLVAVVCVHTAGCCYLGKCARLVLWNAVQLQMPPFCETPCHQPLNGINSVELTKSSIWVHTLTKEKQDALHMVIKLFIPVFLTLLIECFFISLLTSPTSLLCSIRKKQWQHCSGIISFKAVALISQGEVCYLLLCVRSPWAGFLENCPFHVRIGYWEISKFAACVGRIKVCLDGNQFCVPFSYWESREFLLQKDHGEGTDLCVKSQKASMGL